MNSPGFFWDFSITAYRRDGVADACLALQDDQGIDVNILFFCCWLARDYGRFDDQLFESAVQFSLLWAENVVRPLRSARRWMKSADDYENNILQESHEHCRSEIKSVELLAERFQQHALESLVGPIAGSRHLAASQLDSAAFNLLKYFEFLGLKVSGATRRRLSVVLANSMESATIQSASQALTNLRRG